MTTRPVAPGRLAVRIDPTRPQKWAVFSRTKLPIGTGLPENGVYRYPCLGRDHAILFADMIVRLHHDELVAAHTLAEPS